MKTVLPEHLVSTYDLTVPYAFDVRKLRKQLDAELEKLHPCFPERCAVDYHLRLQKCGKSAGGFLIRASVIDKLQLAAIRKENAGCLLYSGGSHPYPVFSADVFKKRMVCAAIILGTFLLVSSAVRQYAVKKRMIPEEAHLPIPITEPAGEMIGSDSTEAQPQQQDYSPFISRIYEQGGKLSFCLWNADSCSLMLKVAGLFPEQIPAAVLPDTEISFSSISYQGSVPEFEVTLTDAVQSAPDERQIAVSLAEIRALFFENGGILLSETVNPPSVRGTIPESAWKPFAARLQEMLSAAAGVLELSHESGSVAVSLQLRTSVLPFSDIAGIFADAPEIPFEIKLPEDDEQPVLQKQREIGRISRDDGSYVVFFHNEEGKIEQKMYEK